MLYYEQGSPELSLSSSELRYGLETVLASFGTVRKMLTRRPLATRMPGNRDSGGMACLPFFETVRGIF